MQHIILKGNLILSLHFPDQSKQREGKEKVTRDAIKEHLRHGHNDDGSEKRVSVVSDVSEGG